ncbi:hypothetical protein CW704_05675 [Candidatus Bathyarchaeota archaeon]|nr:MAG: hypothetical protein CW704_05675 [Candidatus Bathyarchaeota archaeon]
MKTLFRDVPKANIERLRSYQNIREKQTEKTCEENAMPKENAGDSASTQHQILKVDLRRNSARSFMDEIVVESQVSLYINGSRYSVMSIH